jgi:hypothetical protein
MQNFYQKTPAPCIVNEGILINKTDMLRAIETLESVRYSFIVDGEEMSSGQGIVVKVFASTDSATLIVNECIFVNIMSFNYLRFYINDENATAIELIEDSKVLRLAAMDNETGKSGLSNRSIFSDHSFDEETPAELFDETDDDDRF